ncbi:hypothetical protein MCERE19_03484 [Spirosomataceae bacterium]|jgi:hypothetical protein
MKRLIIIFSVLILTSCDLGGLWKDMFLEVIHNKTGKKFDFKKNGVFVFSLGNNAVFEKKTRTRFEEESIIYSSLGNNRFEFEDGKVLEVEIPSSQYSSIYSLISEKNIVNSGQGKGRVNTIINIYITEEVYDKAK